MTESKFLIPVADRTYKEARFFPEDGYGDIIKVFKQVIAANEIPPSAEQIAGGRIIVPRTNIGWQRALTSGTIVGRAPKELDDQIMFAYSPEVLTDQAFLDSIDISKQVNYSMPFAAGIFEKLKGARGSIVKSAESFAHLQGGVQMSTMQAGVEEYSVCCLGGKSDLAEGYFASVKKYFGDKSWLHLNLERGTWRFVALGNDNWDNGSYLYGNNFSNDACFPRVPFTAAEGSSKKIEVQAQMPEGLGQLADKTLRVGNVYIINTEDMSIEQLAELNRKARTIETIL